MIRFENLRKKYKQVEALKGINLQVGEGELFAYLGPLVRRMGAGLKKILRLAPLEESGLSLWGAYSEDLYYRERKRPFALKREHARH